MSDLPGFHVPNLSIPPAPAQQAARQQLRAAKTAAEEIVDEIQMFEAALDRTQEAWLCVIGAPAGLLMYPRSIGFKGADKLIFDGEDEQGCRVRVMQHVSQLNIALKAVPVSGDTARRIGFEIG